jgi:hypothetical protein
MSSLTKTILIAGAAGLVLYLVVSGGFFGSSSPAGFVPRTAGYAPSRPASNAWDFLGSAANNVVSGLFGLAKSNTAATAPGPSAPAADTYALDRNDWSAIDAQDSSSSDGGLLFHDD